MNDIYNRLRDIAGQRRLSERAAHEAAELQAEFLLRAWSLGAAPVTEAFIASLPEIEIARFLPGPEVALCRATAAMVRSHGRWLVLLSTRVPASRQLWGLAHEIKHIIDDPVVAILYPNGPYELREQMCDYFAGCLLVPKKLLRAAWRSGIQDASVLARRFGVTKRAIRIRLLQTGLVDSRSHYIVREV